MGTPETATSTQTDRAEGYQLVSRSPGLSEDDACELAVWGPSHDSLLEQPGHRASTNFHRLSSGAYCVSRTTLAECRHLHSGHRVGRWTFVASRRRPSTRRHRPRFLLALREPASNRRRCLLERQADLDGNALEIGLRAPDVNLTSDENAADAVCCTVQRVVASAVLRVADVIEGTLVRLRHPRSVRRRRCGRRGCNRRGCSQPA